jgi:hypothetical protein
MSRTQDSSIQKGKGGRPYHQDSACDSCPHGFDQDLENIVIDHLTRSLEINRNQSLVITIIFVTRGVPHSSTVAGIVHELKSCGCRQYGVRVECICQTNVNTANKRMLPKTHHNISCLRVLGNADESLFNVLPGWRMVVSVVEHDDHIAFLEPLTLDQVLFFKQRIIQA